MTRFVSRHRAAALALCAFVLMLSIAASLSRPTPVSVPVQTTAVSWSDTERATWKDRIEEVGGIRAYAEFATLAESSTQAGGHTQAHNFGGLLYEVEGVAGFPACDMRLSMGCYHEFLGQAIAHEGSAVIETLAAKCDALPEIEGQSSCRHGIGHGIQAWLGYKTGDLLEGLRLCRTLAKKYDDPYGGCSSGLFMEYNLRVMIDSGASIRPVEGDNYFAPCDAVGKEDKTTCVFWLPQWWVSLLNTQLVAGADAHTKYIGDFEEAGSRCRSLNPTELFEACFRGIGATVSGFGTSVETVRAACSAASRSSREDLLCSSFAAAVFRSRANPEAPLVCQPFRGVERDYCESYASGAATLLDLTPGE